MPNTYRVAVNCPIGEDEHAIMQRVIDAASKWDSTAEHTRGKLWSNSRGRELVFVIRSPDDDEAEKFCAAVFMDLEVI